MTTTAPADGHSALAPPKTPKKVYRTEFVTAHRACKTTAEREQLALIIKARWTEAELHEFARVYYFRNGKDYPTAASYREAIADLGEHYSGMTSSDAKPSSFPHGWLKEFRKGGSKSMPPRREALLKRGRGNGLFVTPEEYAWPDHTEEFRSMIEQRCRDYFNIAHDCPVHPNAWAASHRAYLREQAEPARKAAVTEAAAREAARIAREAVTLVLSPKAKKRSANRADQEDRAAFEYCYEGQREGPLRAWIQAHPFTHRETQAQRRAALETRPPFELLGKLKPHFSFHFAGHTPEFREEVAALARKDHGLRPNAFISPTRWKAACHKHYVLVAAG
jgi:hypothetical protein